MFTDNISGNPPRRKSRLVNLNITIEKKKSPDILQDLNIAENRPINCFMSQKLNYFGHIIHYNGLKRTTMSGMVSGK